MAEFEKFAHARMTEVAAGVAELALERVVGTLYSQVPTSRETRSRVSASKPSALPTSRAAERPR